jgi:hypothetical protein
MKQMHLKLSAAATGLCFGWLRWQGASLFTAESKGGIVDLEMADTPEKLQHLLAIWNKQVAVNNIYIDFLFIPCYALFLAVCCKYMAEKIVRPSYQIWANRLVKLLVVAALFDVVENILMLMSIAGNYTTETLLLTRLIASSKFLLVGLAILYILFGLFSSLLSAKSTHHGA